MAKKNDITTKTGRERLTPRGAPYFHRIAKGWFLGYRKNKDGTGRWVARYTQPDLTFKHHSLPVGIDYDEALQLAQD